MGLISEMGQTNIAVTAFNRTSLDPLFGQGSGESRDSGAAAEKPELTPIKFYPTDSLLFITQAEVVACKLLSTDKDSSFDLDLPSAMFDPNLSFVTNHSSPVSCVAVADEGWLICSCSEEKIVLSKLDDLLKTFSSATIGVDLGRILGCAVAIRCGLILTCVSKVNELVVIQSTSRDSPLTNLGVLDLTHLEIIASYERINELFTWLQLVFFKDVLHVVGMATGNSVSLKIWEVSSEGQFKLKDHRLSSQSKTISGIDFVHMSNTEEEYNLVLVSPDGHCELFAVTVSGFCLLSRIKLEDFAPSSDPCLGSGDINGNTQMDFRIFSARFLLENETFASEVTEDSSQENAEIENEIDELENSLTYFEKRQVNCPKILIIVASSRGIIIINLRSGETELTSKYDECLEKIGMQHVEIGSAKIWVSPDSSKINVALQPFYQTVLYSVEMNIKIGNEIENEDFTVCTTKEVDVKSVLRKKLKSPSASVAVTPAAKKRPINPRISQGFRRSNSVGTYPVRNTISQDNWGKPRPPATVPKSKGVPKIPGVATTAAAVVSRRTYASGSGTDNDSPPPSARAAVRLKPKTVYKGYGDFSFVECQREGGTCLPTRLSTLSHMRMAFSAGGHEMAVGGNIAPLIIFKTYPKFEPLAILKDSRRITSLHFSLTNNQHLMIATNDGKTEILNWRQEKEALSLQFNSKFNEHVHSQFYYLDKFILQPEDNQIAVYSYRIQEANSMTLEAGRFKMNSQQITALVAANQFYSSTILWAGSNKCLAAFDANTEKEMVSISNAHSKPICLIRINEAPKGLGATLLPDLFLTATNTHLDPIKIWDLRIAKCVSRIGDINSKGFVPTSRPGFSPCGKYIASGFEENTIGIYDIRKINAKVATLKGLRSTALDCSFDHNFEMLWVGCRNGKIWNFSTN